ncbi:probable E3 ubiquitin-protein ligase DTX2 isoform X2 [Acropora millepora]|uniref:probable E3 ubiquitin-protein ligase DTX2 isoform X2 n=1 Tax=Acropora millepora TaxID=45264 RepID=UPI001CF3DC1A|nr:probable E3 ubiquitin-protein ligase DTX2 isoform X2 [Acropora millepora]
MAAASPAGDVIVWEWKQESSLWIPYQEGVCQLLEKKFMELRQNTSKKMLAMVNLGDCDPSLDCYEVDLVSWEQIRVETGNKREVRRQIYPSNSVPGQGLRWEWDNDVAWVAYDIPTSEQIERKYIGNKKEIDLSRTALGIPNILYFHNMVQVNKYTYFERPVQRLTNQSYPMVKPDYSVAKTSPSKSTKCTAKSNHTLSTSGNKSSKTKQAVGTEKKAKKPKVVQSQAATSGDPLSDFCNDLETAPDEDCAICFEKLCNISSFDDESGSSEKSNSSGIKQLTQCKHSFHASCLQAMYNSGTKDGSLQCPTCKAIHGVKHGNQPKDGSMTVHHSQDSLPGHPDCGMITIIYDFRGGLQGPEHPNPGRSYTARGFPRTCYLPDNHKGRKVLKLLREAWRRRLIFTVGTSSTTAEQDTVVWNEIHHKTEPFSNHKGHGFPDPNYLDNVLSELAAQGVQPEKKNSLGPGEGVGSQGAT